MASANDGSEKVTMSIDPGVCRFKTKIITRYTDGEVRYEIASDCPHVKKLGAEMKEGLSPMDALRMPFSANPIYERCGACLAHSACPIPSALIKSAEAAAGLGLKRNVKFEFEP